MAYRGHYSKIRVRSTNAKERGCGDPGVATSAGVVAYLGACANVSAGAVATFRAGNLTLHLLVMSAARGTLRVTLS